MKLKSLLLFMIILSSSVPLSFAEESKTIIEEQNFFVEYDLPSKNSNPFALTTDPNGIVWFSERNTSSVTSFDPTTKNFKTFKINPDTEILEIWSITSDTDGNIWFTDATQNKIHRIDTTDLQRSEIIQSLDIPTPDALPWDIKEDNFGNMWFTEFGSGKLGKITFHNNDKTKINTITEYEIPGNYSQPSYLDIDKQGNIWFVESGSGKITKFDSFLETFDQYTLPNPYVNGSINPIGIVIDDEGYIWYTQFRTSLLGRLDPSSGQIAEFSTGTLTSGTYQLVKDRWGDIWTLQFRADRLIEINPTDLQIWEFTIPTQNSFAQTLAPDPSGDIWFIESGSSKLGFFNMSLRAPFITNFAFVSAGAKLDGSENLCGMCELDVLGRRGTINIRLSFIEDYVGNLFFIARGNMAPSGLLKDMEVKFFPDKVDLDTTRNIRDRSNVFVGHISNVQILHTRDLTPGTYYITVGATTNDLSYYAGKIIELHVEPIPSSVPSFIMLIFGLFICFSFLNDKPKNK